MQMRRQRFYRGHSRRYFSEFNSSHKISAPPVCLSKEEKSQFFASYSSESKLAIECLFSLPNGEVLSADGEKICVWDPVSGTKLREISTGMPIKLFAYHPDVGLACAHSTGGFSIWNLNTGKRLQHFGGESGSIDDLAFLSANQLISCHLGGGYHYGGQSCHGDFIRIQDITTSTCIYEEPLNDVSCYSLAPYSPTQAILGCSDGTLRLFDVSNKKCLDSFQVSDKPIRRIIARENGQAIASDAAGTVVLWDPKKGTGKIISVPGHQNARALDCSRFNATIFIGTDDGKIHCWNPENNTIVAHPVRTVQDPKLDSFAGIGISLFIFFSRDIFVCTRLSNIYFCDAAYLQGYKPGLRELLVKHLPQQGQHNTNDIILEYLGLFEKKQPSAEAKHPFRLWAEKKSEKEKDAFEERFTKQQWISAFDQTLDAELKSFASDEKIRSTLLRVKQSLSSFSVNPIPEKLNKFEDSVSHSIEEVRRLISPENKPDCDRCLKVLNFINQNISRVKEERQDLQSSGNFRIYNSLC